MGCLLFVVYNFDFALKFRVLVSSIFFLYVLKILLLSYFLFYFIFTRIPAMIPKWVSQ